MYSAFKDIKVGDTFALTDNGILAYHKCTVVKLTPKQVTFDNGYVCRLSDGYILGTGFYTFRGVPWNESHENHNRKVNTVHSIRKFFNKAGNIRIQELFNLPPEALDQVIESINVLNNVLPLE